MPIILKFEGYLADIYQALSGVQQDSSAKERLQIYRFQFEILTSCLSRSASCSSGAISKMKWNLTQFDSLVSYAKEKNSAEYFSVLFKNSPPCINTFAKTLMPILEEALLENKIEVLQMLKIYQQATRNVQLICNHLKNSRDSKVSKRIPMVKKILESSLLRIKQMLENNNCHSAFWMGNLKHRDLDGKEVCSQVPLNIETDEINSDSNENSGSTEIDFDRPDTNEDVDDSGESCDDDQISDICENDAQTLALSL